MKFYIASRLENAAQVKLVASVLKAAGHTHTYDWTTHGSVQSAGKERISEVAHNEIEGVREAGLVIVILPGGRGTHAELGAALALNKPVILCAADDALLQHDERTCAFYWHPYVTRVIGEPVNWLEVIFNHIQSGAVRG